MKRYKMLDSQRAERLLPRAARMVYDFRRKVFSINPEQLDTDWAEKRHNQLCAREIFLYQKMGIK